MRIGASEDGSSREVEDASSREVEDGSSREVEARTARRHGSAVIGPGTGDRNR